MTHPEIPDEHTRDDEQDAGQRGKCIQPLGPFGSIQYVQHRQIVYAAERNDESKKLSYPVFIDMERILGHFPSTVRKDVRDFKALDRPEAHRSSEHIDPCKNKNTACHHQHQSENFQQRPVHTNIGARPDKNDDAHQKSACTGELELRTKYLQDRIAWSNEQSVKVSSLDKGREAVESPGETFTERKSHMDNSKTKGNFKKCPPLQLSKPVEEKVQSGKHRERNEKLTQG